MMWFKCGKMQVYNTLKQKDKILKEWLQGNGRMKRKGKVTGNEEEINEIKGEKCTESKEILNSVIVWEYGGRNGKASHEQNQDVSRT
jgi:hypothetical protein